MAWHNWPWFCKANHVHAKPWKVPQTRCDHLHKHFGLLCNDMSSACAHSLCVKVDMISNFMLGTQSGWNTVWWGVEVHASTPHHVGAFMVWSPLLNQAWVCVANTKEKHAKKCAPSFCSVLCGQVSLHLSMPTSTSKTHQLVKCGHHGNMLHVIGCICIQKLINNKIGIYSFLTTHTLTC
jgi:hypothetical protein